VLNATTIRPKTADLPQLVGKWETTGEQGAEKGKSPKGFCPSPADIGLFNFAHKSISGTRIKKTFVTPHRNNWAKLWGHFVRGNFF
jgi:hypothetical protein